MRVTKRRGFTIIETMLFLAISGVLTVAIMVGAGAAIGAQRYKDAVATLQSDLQQQYEDVTSIKNSREGAGTVPHCAEGRGRTSCVLMGKLMTITGDGRMTQYSVYGREPAGSSDNEYDAMRDYGPAVVADTEQVTKMEWGTGIAWPQYKGLEAQSSGLVRNIGILVIRSPQSGIAYTFTRDTDGSGDLQNMIDSGHRGRRTICVATSGWVVNDRMSVTIAAGASSASAVQVRTNQLIANEGNAGDGGLQC